jgi:peptidyl-prolyl cis-trans isomerase SurA
MVVVGGAPITYSDYLRAAAQRNVALKKGEINQAVLEALIDDKVVSQAAKNSGKPITENELASEIANYLKSQNTTQAELQQQLKQKGSTWEAFRQNVRDSLTVARFQNTELAALLPGRDLRQYTREILEANSVKPTRVENNKKVEIKRKMNLGHILVLLPQNPSPEQLRQSEARIQTAFSRLRRGEAFAKVAAAVSDAPEGKRNKGELGLLAVNDYPELFVVAVQNLKKGEFTKPFRSPVGFHILKSVARESEFAEISTKQKVVESLVRHVLIPVKNQDEVKAARQLAENLSVEIKNKGVEFAQIASVFSKDASAKNGGIIGWAQPGQLVPEFENVMHTLPLRSLSQPVLTPFGVHLLEVIERRVVDNAALDAAASANGINSEGQKEFEQAKKTWLEKLRSNTFIEYRDPPL